MNSNDLKQRIERVERCADDAKNALQSGNVQQELRDAVMQLHQQASQLKKQGVSDENQARQPVMQLEEAADQAKEACQRAGNVDQKLKDAILQAHSEASRLKKELQAGSPA
jgi:hypothetical protein